MDGVSAVLERARCWSAHFEDRGIFQGARIGAYGLQSSELFAFWLGCAGSGRIPVLLNDKFTVDNLGTAFEGVPMAAVATSSAATLPVPKLGIPTPGQQGPWREPHADQTALIVFTSGSSGNPKGVALSWGNLKASTLATAAFYGVRADESWLSPLPLFHVGGFMVLARAWFTGVQALMPAADESVRDIVVARRPAWISFVPTQLARLMDDRECLDALRCARGILLGGAETPVWLQERIAAEGLPVSYTYGMSESASQLAATLPGEAADTLRVLSDREVRIERDGRLAMRGEVRFQGYWIAGRFSKPFDADGWFITQDVAQWTDRGALKILGRADEIFQCGGENIAPAQIERVLGVFASDAALVVSPFPDPVYGFVPVLVVESEVRPDAVAMREHFQKNLPGLFRPRAVYWHRASSKNLKPERAKWRGVLSVGIVPAGIEKLP